MKGLSLRAALRLLGIGALAYVGVIAAIVALRIGPTARALRVHSERVRQEYEAINDRSAALHGTIDEIEMWVYTVAQPGRLEPALGTLRTRIDSLTQAASAAPPLSGIPTAMRLEFSRSSVEQSRLGIALLEALSNLELGREAAVKRYLTKADSIARLMDRHMAVAQRVGLDDLIAREQALVAAATSSLRALGVWAALGILIAPFVLVFVRRRLFDPLEDLAEGISQVAEGDLGWSIPVHRADELGRLSQHFNHATAILCQRAEETRQRAQTALRQSEERYEAMVELAPVGVAVVDAEGRYVHTNPAFQHLLGYTEAELRGRAFNDVTAPDDREAGDRLFQELRRGERDRYQIEKRYVRKDGRIVCARLSVVGVRDAAGRLIHTVSTIEDVTEEKRRDVAARESETRLREEQAALVEIARHPAFTAGNVHAVWRELTETAAETLGVARASVWIFDPAGAWLRCEDLYEAGARRHTAGVTLAAADMPAYFRALREERVIAASDARTDARTRELTGGYLVPLGITSILDAPIRTGGSQLGVVCHEHCGPTRSWTPAEQGFAGSMADLAALALETAERTRAEAARRKSDEKFATAFRLSPNPSVISRLRDGLLVDVNDAYTVATGFSREEVVGRSAREVLWSDPERRDEFVRALKEQGRVRDLELRMRTKPGAPLDVLVSVEVIELDGEPHTLGAAVDITARKRAAEALRQSEEKFAKAFRASPNSITITELESGVLVDANDAFFSVTGYTREEAIGRSTRELIWRDVAQRDAFMARLKADGRIRGMEVAIHAKAGAAMTALVSSETIELEGRPYLLTEALDITERKRVAEALRESEERFRRLVQDLSIGVALLDPNGHVIHANPAARDILSLTDQEIRDPTFWQRELTALREDGTPYPAAERPVLSAVRTGTSLQNVLLGIPPRGRHGVRWATVNVDPQRDADGIVRNVIVSFVEITEQRRAAEALRESEAQLRLLAQAVKSTGESISITDLEGRFTVVNPAFATTCGYTEAELIGQPVALINSPLNPPGLQAEVREATRRDRAWSGELYNRRKDGTDFPIALTTAQVKDSEGRVIALMGVSSDITERRHLRESVRRSETMSALGAVVAGVAHEVRNPLFGISATVDAFEARFGADPAHQRYTQTLRQEVGRLTKLMQDLLEYGRPPRLDVANVEIAPVIERAVAACEALATNGGVTIRQDVPDRLPRVPLDPSRIQQVFQNLIENAIQHSPQGGTVMVVAAAGNGGLEVTVADQGSGFRGEDLPHLFEPFFTRRRGGTGLGLSIVQRIIEQHGGEVAARNGPQGGAVVTVNLKLAEAARV